MTKKTARDYEADLTRLEAAVRESANQTAMDTDLTPEGRMKRHAGWVKERRWADAYQEAATGLMGALESATAKAAQVRQTMTALPEGDAALAQELRYQRRAKRIDAALNSGGSGALAKLIADADDAELPILIEHATDHFDATGGNLGKAGREIIEAALRQRNSEYDAAARVAGQAGNALTVAREKLGYMQALLEDPHTPPPAEYSVARMSVTVAGEDVGDLAA